MPHPERSNPTYRTIARIVRPVLRALTRRDWRGAEHLPREGGWIAAANHVTMVDPLTFGHFLYDNDVAPKILAKESLFRLPVVGRVVRSSGQIPVHRDSARAKESLASGISALEAGECVAVFPEGTLTRDPDLWPMASRTGVARLALTTRVPVIPIAQWGAHRILAPYGKVPHLLGRKKVTVVAGPPVDLSDLYDRPQDPATLREATDRVMSAVTAMLEEIRGERAPEVRFDPRRPKEGA